MSRFKNSDAEPSFGRQLAVFVTVFVLVFGPCLPVSPYLPIGVQAARAVDWADYTIGGDGGNASISGSARQDLSNYSVTITGNGSVNISNSQIANEFGGALKAAQIIITGNGSVNLTGNNATTPQNTTGNGGAMYANHADLAGAGNITINGTGHNTFSNNTADNKGGAIFAEYINISSSGNNLFSGNKAVNNASSNESAGGKGGAIFGAQNVTLGGNGTHTFSDNSVSDGTGANQGGGAIYASNVAITGKANFTNNSAEIVKPGSNPPQSGLSGGGAIYVTGNVILNGTTTFEDNVVNNSQNLSTTGGGAIFAANTINLTGTNTFSNNTVVDAGSDSYGGAIYASTALNINGGTNAFSNNSAAKTGGAIAAGTTTISNGTNTFTNNTATTGNGGAIYSSGDVILSGGTNHFNGNTAGPFGGGISSAGSVSISGGTNDFSGNKAKNNNSYGGAIFAGTNINISGGTNTFNGNNASTGGAIVASKNMVISGGNTTFTNNTGGAIYAQGNISLIPDANSSIVFKNATETIKADKYYVSNVAYDGWLHIGGLGNTTFEAGFTNNGSKTVHFGTNNYTAYNASTGWANSTSLNVTQNNTTFSTVSNGWADKTGGGRATTSYSTITGNFALADNQTLSLDMNVDSNAKVPYFAVTDGNVTTGTNTTLYGMIGSSLSGNSSAANYTYAVFSVANGNGTAFAPANYFTSNKLVTLANPTFYGDATSGVFTVEVQRAETPKPNPDPDPPTPPTPDPDPTPPTPPTPDPGGVEIPKNETHSGGTADNGGGIFSNGTTNITQNATANFTGNTARDSGAGLYSTDSVTVQDNATAHFANNTAANKGGGLYSGGNITSAGTTAFVASGNTANLGGGVYANGTVTLSGNADFSGNTAKDKGGAIYATGDVNIVGSASFSGNTATTEGGAIYTDNDVHVTPEVQKSIRFVTHSDSIRANNLYVDGQGTGYFNASNAIAGTVIVKSGTAQLATANTFSNTVVRVEGGTLHMGDVAANQPKSHTARTYGMAALADNDIRTGGTGTTGVTGTTGSGASASYATNLKGFSLGSGTTLSLDMNVAGNANVPYFTLADGYAATTGANTTLYGVIGSNLANAENGKWTYSIFSGSNGAAGAFAPANYRTSNILVSLVNPTYANGEFTLDVVRNNQPEPPTPDPDPVPPTPDPDPTPDPVPPTPNPDPTPTPKPVITGDFMGLFPRNSLRADMETILYYDYFYNGGTIANPGPGTLIGQNAFMDRLMLVLPNGQDAFTPTERLLALDGAASMTDMSGSIEMLRDTGNRLRGQIFATDAVRNNRATITKAADGTRINLWAAPTYSHENSKTRGQYGSVDARYSFNTYGGVIGLDALVGEGKFRVGGVFTVGHGKLDSAQTTNSADYVGGALFGAWLPASGWEIGIYTGYMGQKNDVEQSNILNLKSKFDAGLWQIGTNVQYSTAIGNDGKRKLTAGLGVDTQLFKRDSHGISASGKDVAKKDVAKVGKSDLTQVQIPLTVGLQDTFEFDNGSSLTLDGRVGYRLTAGDLATKGDWSIPGGNHKARITGPDADRNTGLAGVGALWRKDQLAVGVSYDVELGAKRTNHQLSGQVRWEF